MLITFATARICPAHETSPHLPDAKDAAIKDLSFLQSAYAKKSSQADMMDGIFVTSARSTRGVQHVLVADDAGQFVPERPRRARCLNTGPGRSPPTRGQSWARSGIE